MRKGAIEINKSKYIIIILALLSLPVIAILVLTNISSLGASDWATAIAAIITYIGTSALGVVAIYQSDKANALSEKVYELSQREYEVIFSVKDAKVDSFENCQKNSSISRMLFCYVNTTPQKCQEYVLTLQNYSRYPITHIDVTTTYTVGRNRTLESLTRDLDIIIGPQETRELALCNHPKFDSKNGKVEFEIKCSNYYGKESVVELSFSFQREGAEGNVEFECKVKENMQAEDRR